MEFIAINLDDFHKYQRNATTIAEMVFVKAEGIDQAQKYMKLNHPESPWALVCKQIFDANIVTKVAYKGN